MFYATEHVCALEHMYPHLYLLTVTLSEGLMMNTRTSYPSSLLSRGVFFCFCCFCFGSHNVSPVCDHMQSHYLTDCCFPEVHRLTKTPPPLQQTPTQQKRPPPNKQTPTQKETNPHPCTNQIMTFRTSNCHKSIEVNSHKSSKHTRNKHTQKG